MLDDYQEDNKMNLGFGTGIGIGIGLDDVTINVYEGACFLFLDDVMSNVYRYYILAWGSVWDTRGVS